MQMGQIVKLGRALPQIGVSRTNSKLDSPLDHTSDKVMRTFRLTLLFSLEGWQSKLNEQRSLELYSRTPEISEYSSALEETEKSLQTAKLHSRSQSLSSSEIFHLLSVNNISACSGNCPLDGNSDDNGNNDLDTNEGIKQSVDEIRALLSSGNVQCTRHQKYNIKHPNYMSLWSVAKWFTDKLANLVQMEYRRNREVVRLQTAQMHAALSAARLATAVVGIIGNCSFQSTNMNDISMNHTGKHSDKNTHAAITSAVALVAASCAEAAKSSGASSEQVSSVINMGLDTTTTGDLLTLTTSTAACLRGAECLKMRTIRNYALQDHKNKKKGAILAVRTPEGRIHNRIVSVDCNYCNDNVMLTLRKGHCFTTSKKYIILCDQGEQKDSGYQRDEHGYHTINLLTSSGTVQLLFAEHGQYSSWKSFINYLIFSKGQKLSHLVKT